MPEKGKKKREKSPSHSPSLSTNDTSVNTDIK
jgi:hypothetical protein